MSNEALPTRREIRTWVVKFQRPAYSPAAKPELREIIVEGKDAADAAKFATETLYHNDVIIEITRGRLINVRNL